MKSKTVYYLIIPIALAIFFSLKTNNSCTTNLGYLNIYFSKDCYYNPDVDDDIFGIIRRHVGVSEVHEVQTEDGYTLGLFRIPKDNPKGVVLLQHPVNTDARIWLAQSNESLPVMLWHEGYDVWLGNTRGTFYSQKHQKLTTADKSFWNYSLDEIGFYDHHATIPYISKKTNGSKIIYVGVSMGATTGLIYAITRPEEASNLVKLMIVASPVTYMKNGNSFLRKIMPVVFFIQNATTDECFPITSHESVFLTLFRFFAVANPFKRMLHYFFEGPIAGWSDDEQDPKFWNLFYTKLGSEASFKVYKHFQQFYGDGGIFHMYNYGEEKNLIKYGTKSAPLYHPEKIKLPVLIVSSTTDSIVHDLDNQYLYSRLSDKAKIYGMLRVDEFNHINYFNGRHRVEKFYKKIFRVMERVP